MKDLTVATWINAAIMFFTFLSVLFAYREYKHHKIRAQKETSCNLAKYYADSIIKAHAFISNVFTQCGTLEVVNKYFELDAIHNFDIEELKAFQKKADISEEELTKKLVSFDPLVILNCRIARKELLADRERIYREFVTKGEDENTLILKNPQFILNDFKQDIIHLLNDLEWFSMNCMYNVADEKLLYQSLHQSFLSIVWMLYYFISSNNTNNEDKTYTNTIALFVLWRQRLNSIVEDSKRRIEKIQPKIDESKPKIYTGKRL